MTVGSNVTNLNRGMRCIKYMLFVINFMFVLTAILLISIGTTIKTILGSFDYFVDDHFLSPPTLVVAIGVILLIVALFGCFGAIKESTALINIYGVFLAIIFILQVSAAISGFALQSQVKDMLERTMRRSIYRYPEYEYVQESVDFMQMNLECCGVNGPQDWEGIFPEALSTSTVPGFTDLTTVADHFSLELPDSCCYSLTDIAEGKMECISPYEIGCFNRMNFIVSQSTILIATGATAVAFVQLLGVICAFMLAKTIRRTKSLREARRYQLQQSIIGAFSEKSNFKQQEYTQLENKDKLNEPVIYVPSSPSIN